MLLRHLYIVLLLNNLQIVKILCDDGISVAFAIDNTRSMGKVLDDVKKYAISILNAALEKKSNEIRDLILVSINDPDSKLLIKTNSSSVFYDQLNDIHIFRSPKNNDCEEMALTGIEKALENSRPGSYIFVFTDASAKDYDKVDNITYFCQKKQVKVFFILTGECKNSNSRDDMVYYDIAKATFGQVFRLKVDEVNSMLRVIRELLDDKKSVIAWKVFQPSYIYQKMEITIDEKSLNVIISSNAADMDLRVTKTRNLVNGEEQEIEKIMWTSNVKVAKLIDPKPGNYYARVNGSTLISVVVYAATKFTFTYGFSTQGNAKSVEYTSKQPFDNSDVWPILQKGGKLDPKLMWHLFDIAQHLYIQVTDDSVHVQDAHLLDMNGKELIKLGLNKISKNFYVSPSFTVPACILNIRIISFIKPSNQLVIRISKTPIDPSPNVTTKSLPQINIIETQRNFSYGSTAEFTCKVESQNGKPLIKWTDEEGAIWENMVTQISASDYYSRLKINQARRSAVYTCSATNNVGTSKENVDITVASPFNVRQYPEASLKIPYGTKKTVHCDVRSPYPMKIKWYRQDRTKSSRVPISSDKLSISSDGSELIIKSMDLDLIGIYTCEASLARYSQERITFKTDVDITGIEKPTIVSSFSVVSGNKFWASCRVKGVPKPVISWHFKPKDSEIFHKIPGDGEELNIPKLSPVHSGTYRCEAKNVLDMVSRDFDEVILELKPEVNIIEGKKLLVQYNAEVLLTCKVNAYPKPEIKWFTSDGELLSPFETSNVKMSEYISKLRITVKNNETYTCNATNSIGSGVKSIQVELRSVFRTISSPAETTNAKYGENVKIKCNVQSSFPMEIIWYKSDKTIVNDDVYHVSDDGMELTIKIIDLESQGKYSCIAYLVTDHSQNVQYKTKVQINGLELPGVQSSNNAVSIMKGDKFDLTCKIVKGYPKSDVWWNKKAGEHFKPISSKTGEVLTVKRALLSDARQYQCIAKNVMGNVSVVFDVTVRSGPEMNVTETQRNFTYGSDVEFTCNVESYIRPTIHWTDEKGAILEDKVTKNSEFYYSSRLKLSKVKSSTVYTCTARNDIDVSKARVPINVSSPFAVGKNSETIIEIPYGAEKAIQCDIKSSEPLKIKWYRSNNDTKSTRASVISSDKLPLSSDGSKLIIKSMDVDLNGRYTCEASLVSDPEKKASFETHINVTGLAAPEVNLNTFVEDKNLTVVCSVKGVPKPALSWQFKPKGSETFQTIPGSVEILNIPTLSRNHSGTFKCVATNILGVDYGEIDVVVKEEPKITNEINKYTALDGDKALRISCNVSGTPDPVVIWKKDGETIENSSKYDIKKNALYIMNLTEADSANYTCEAVNELGTESKTFEAIVTDTFKIDNEALKGNTHIIYATKENSLIMTCNYKYNSKSLLPRWYLNGQYTNYTGGVYKIAAPSKKDIGIYTCRVDTNEGSLSESFNLQVGSPPYFIYESLTAAIEEKLDCAVESESAEVQWLRDGVVVPTINNTQEYVANKWGEYKCVASNVFGSVERTYKIESTDCYVNEHMTTQNMPLYFYEEKLRPGSSAGIRLKANKSIILVCASNDASINTFQEFPSKNRISAECYKEDKFIINGKIYKFSQLQCKAKVEPLIVNKHEECAGPGTELIRVGFTVDFFWEIYTICYDMSKDIPLFGNTLILIDDFAINEQSLFEWSQTPAVGDGNPTLGYTCPNTTDCCYMKSQMISVDEMVFGPAQAATLKDHLNSVPVWIPCESDTKMSWKTFESNVRVRSLENNNWRTWTGASDYRNENDGLIPRYLWKVIENNEYFGVVVYVNTPESIDDDIRCYSSCDSLNLYLDSDAAYKFYCCNLEDFSKAFNITSASFNRDASDLPLSSA